MFVCAAVNEYQNYEISKEYLKVDEILINTRTEKEMNNTGTNVKTTQLVN